MSSKDKKTKLSKTAKAALPFFALFGGQGFASSRNPLTLQSSKKLTGKSVVSINEIYVPELPVLGSKRAQQTKFPFAAFTNQSIPLNKNASIKIQHEVMNFLNGNNLLHSKKTTNSSLSGNISNHTQKLFSHSWSSTTMGAALSTATKTGTFSCTFYSNPSNRNYSMHYNLYGTGNAYCTANYIKGGVTTYRALSNVSVAACIALHSECDNQILPVELQKFEIE